MDLSTTYLGLPLAHPFMPGASPLVDDLGVVRNLEDAGASAIVLHSLFEEQIEGEGAATRSSAEAHTNSFAEAMTYLPAPSEFTLGPDAYLEQLRKIRAAVKVPVIASLNGTTASGWLRYAALLEQAGASAIELNVYYVATDPNESGQAVERRTLEAVRTVKAAVKVPVAVKLSPYFSSLSHFAAELEAAGADGLVVFNRFYQPDLDLDALEVVPRLTSSSSADLLLRLRWAAVLSAQRKLSIGISGGVHNYHDALKAVASGASAVQLVAALLRFGPDHLGAIRQEVSRWLEQHEYSSLRQLQGSLSQAKCPDPAAFERGNYVRILQSWRTQGAKVFSQV
jgi:dihydroorotate dehydrogenase (fumarate)